MELNRILIIGGCGTGKTTLSNNLAKIHDLPVYHIDGINYFPNWKERDRDERDKIIIEITNKEKWIIDGTYTSTLKERIDVSDKVIYLDYSNLAKIKGVLSRYYKNKGIEKPEIPGCEERMSLKFLKFTYSWNKRKRKKIYEILDQCQGKDILIFKNRRKLNKWFENNYNKKIEL